MSERLVATFTPLKNLPGLREPAVVDMAARVLCGFESGYLTLHAMQTNYM
jgi:hypothetical protein